MQTNVCSQTKSQCKAGKGMAKSLSLPASVKPAKDSYVTPNFILIAQKK
jgi:hypothetical protein